MDNLATSPQLLLTLGGVFLLGLVTSTIGRRTFLPRVTLLLLFGVLIGDAGLGLIPPEVGELFPVVADMALVMVGFLLGGQLTPGQLRSTSAEVLAVSLSAALVTAAMVCAGLWALGLPLPVALLLGCIASATDAASVFDVVQETGSESRFSRGLLAMVALDDVWALVLFSAGMAVATAAMGAVGETGFVLTALRDVFGALFLGGALGVPAAYLTGRVRPGQPVLSEAVGLVFLCGGLALWLEVSFLIAAMTLGAVIANLARHHEYPFHAIEDIENPVLLLFFVLAGASLDVAALVQLGIIGVSYLGLRSLGKVVGARLGGLAVALDGRTARQLGYALLPQAGVAIGMALVAANHLPEYRTLLLTLVISSTVFFEIVGPVFSRRAVLRGRLHEPRPRS
ncbi:cation:proton antiporter [Pseudohaliea rubra]|uniref:Na(+)/H(+) antiporter,-like protein n=1 Tax=Pseudohaliea rubra DSM 19751 TaxID=1265313 RepID=A0A095VMR0_9GAMM|nr:cation:proton antiporter [Pseudohaliea rubra]KGE02772.1 Na(+)/H(+) antiporter,-like protein [Pseudohaliea rubra DSM 19751]